MSDKAEFVILLMADLKWLSKVWRAGLSADGEQRNKCSTFGLLLLLLLFYRCQKSISQSINIRLLRHVKMQANSGRPASR